MKICNMENASKEVDEGCVKTDNARTFKTKVRAVCFYLALYLSISRRILKSCSCSSGVLAERNS